MSGAIVSVGGPEAATAPCAKAAPDENRQKVAITAAFDFMSTSTFHLEF
jgi:hypothetical protein